jgi:biopolymer transport protein ExbB
LAFAVFVVVTVMIYKLAELAMVVSRLRGAQKAVAGGLSMPAGDSPLAQAAQAAQAELAGLPAQVTPGLRASARERLDLTLDRIDAGAVERLRFGTGVLASIGSVAPFVGLFGTVFGIMNSFLAIAATKTTNLAVVAPGIAEALLATGLGLVAAIPAVILYNHLMRRIKAYRHRLADGLAEVQRQFSRALDARMGA